MARPRDDIFIESRNTKDRNVLGRACTTQPNTIPRGQTRPRRVPACGTRFDSRRLERIPPHEREPATHCDSMLPVCHLGSGARTEAPRSVVPGGSDRGTSSIEGYVTFGEGRRGRIVAHGYGDLSKAASVPRRRAGPCGVGSAQYHLRPICVGLSLREGRRRSRWMGSAPREGARAPPAPAASRWS
jgi:hypothetical protein